MTDVAVGDSAVVSPTSRVARPVQTKEDLELYMKSREIIKTGTFAVVVDGFRFTSQYLKLRYGELPPGQAETGGFRTTFILTHFHSDHYVGLYKSWTFGKIFCSRGTGMLLQNELGVAADRIVPLEMDQMYLVDLQTSVATATDGSTSSSSSLESHQILLTLVGANHCPASVMLVIESKAFGTIVHTGDFRYNGKSIASATATAPALRPQATNQLHRNSGFREKFIGDHPALRRVAGSVDVLFLDNTFCDRTFRFPSQAAVFQQVANVVEDAFSKTFDTKHTCRSVVVTAGDAFVDVKGDGKRCSCYLNNDSDGGGSSKPPAKCLHIAVLVGTYTIGKERVALAVRNRFGVPIYSSPEKYNILKGCDASREFGCDDDAFRCAKRSEDILETRISTNSLVGLAERRDAQRALTFADDDDPENGEVCAFLTLILVPLSVLSYPYLADCLGTQKKQQSSTEDGSGSPTTETALEEGTDPKKSSSSCAIRLWNQCDLDVDRFDAIIGIEPTGWAEGRSPSRVLKKVGKKIVVHSVPYSEHCSFDEMVDFVAFVKPLKVVPTVSFDMFAKNEPLFVERCPRLRSKYSNTQPLSKFQHMFKKPGSNQISPMANTASVSAAPSALPATTSSVVDGSTGELVALKTVKQTNPFARDNRTTAKRPREGMDLKQERHKNETVISDDGSDEEIEIIPVSYTIDD